MADGPHNATLHAGQVVRRVLLRRTSSSTRNPRSSPPPLSRPRTKPARPSGRRTGARVLPPLAASRCSDPEPVAGSFSAGNKFEGLGLLLRVAVGVPGLIVGFPQHGEPKLRHLVLGLTSLFSRLP